jgi:hypothetical protein
MDDEPFTPDYRREESESPIVLTASPELDKGDAKDRHMEEMGRPRNVVTPASLSVEAALSDVSIIEVPTPLSPQMDQQTPMQPRGLRRGMLFSEDPSAVEIPRAGSGPALFDVYSDTPATVKNVSRNPTRQPMLVRRQLSNVVVEARSWHLDMSNASSKGHTTKTVRTSHPFVNGKQLLHGGRCVVSFRPDLELDDPPPLGVISISLASLPSQPATRKGEADMLRIDPVYVMPPARHVTLIMPSVQPSTLLDHFVLDLVNGAGEYLVRLAFAKVVLASLLYTHETELTFYDVPVAEGVSVAVVLYVQRIRKDTKNGRLLASVEQVDWYVPEGLERVRWNRWEPAVEEARKEEEEVETPAPQVTFRGEEAEDDEWDDVEAHVPVASMLFI